MARDALGRRLVGSPAVSTVRVLADVALAAVRLRLDGPFVVWSAARTLDVRGTGRAEFSALCRLVSSRWVRQAFRAGFLRDGGSGWVYCASSSRVAAILGLRRVRGTGFAAPLQQFLVGAALRRARLALGATAALRRGKPISVVAIAMDSGVSERTVFAWLNVARWPRRRRLALEPGIVSPGTLRWLRAAQDEGEPFLVVKRRGRLRLARRLPSSLGKRWGRESRTWLARRINDARPASSAPVRAPRGAAAGHHPSSKSTSQKAKAPSLFDRAPAIAKCRIVPEVFVRGSEP